MRSRSLPPSEKPLAMRQSSLRTTCDSLNAMSRTLTSRACSCYVHKFVMCAARANSSATLHCQVEKKARLKALEMVAHTPETAIGEVCKALMPGDTHNLDCDDTYSSSCPTCRLDGWVDGGAAENNFNDSNCIPYGQSSWYGTLADAKQKCDEDSQCTVLHDYNADAQNWRACKEVTLDSGGAAATLVREPGSPWTTSAPSRNLLPDMQPLDKVGDFVDVASPDSMCEHVIKLL